MVVTRLTQLGIKSLLLHPLRSLLTVLGIFIGVASVIWLLAIGEGISSKAQEQIAGLGANNIIIRSIKPTGKEAGTGYIARYGLTQDDHARLAKLASTITRALPIRELRREFRYRDRLVDGRLVGCTRDYAEVTQLSIDRGRFLEDTDIATNANTCVLAAEVAQQLFQYENPLGKAVRLGEDYYTVVGILQPRAATASIGGSLEAQDFSGDVYIPISTLWHRIGHLVFTRRAGSREGEYLELNQITLRVDQVENVQATAEIVEQGLSDHLEKGDVQIIVPLELLEQAETTRLMFMLLMGLIAAISLLVGGIGIMNIMLATVTERTREIGIRRALGARQRDIVSQFLVETLVLSIAGGATGILGGLACVPMITLVQRALNRWAPELIAQLPATLHTLTPKIVPLSLPLAFTISLLVGVVFGIYPAMRAARMDPIEALRHE